jgi:hypothetical protein
MINAYRILVGKPEGIRALRRPRHRWKDNFKLGLSGKGWKGVDRIHLVEDSDL